MRRIEEKKKEEEEERETSESVVFQFDDSLFLSVNFVEKVFSESVDIRRIQIQLTENLRRNMRKRERKRERGREREKEKERKKA